MTDAAIFGLIVADLIASPMDLRAPPAPGGLRLLDAIHLTTGGNVSNTGIAMARMGMQVSACGMVGRDALGAAVLQRLRDSGLDVAGIHVDERAQTSSTVVAVEPGGERVFFHVPGVTRLLDGRAFRQWVPIFAKCWCVQIGYFGLLPALTPELPQCLEELRAAGPNVRIALDTVNPPASRQLLDPILPHLDIFCPSRSEAAELTGRNDPAAMVASFRQHMRQGIIGIKLDSEGCYLDDGREAVFCPAYKVNVVDTTGAGDTWFAGLLVALRKAMPLASAGRFANRAAADCCTSLGASTGVKSFEQTLARL